MMPKSENLSETDQERQAVEKLRQSVLKWIGDKNPVPVKSSSVESEKTTKKNPPAASPPKKITTPPRSRKRVIKKISWLIVSLILMVTIYGLLLYQFNWHDPLTLAITKFLPYPAAWVNYQPVSYYQWQKQIASLNNFYQREKQNNSDLQLPTSAETQRHILDRMIDQLLIKQIAQHYNIQVTPEEIKQQTQSLAKEIGTEQELTQQLAELYGWEIKDFQQEILEPLLLKNKVNLALAFDERINQAAKNKAVAILAQVQTGEKTFEELARQYSEDTTASQGGDLGYISPGQMVPEFETAAFKLGPGEVSPLVQTQFGYHIIQAADVKKENETVTQVRVRHILIRTQGLDAYLKEFKVQAQIWQWAKIKQF